MNNYEFEQFVQDNGKDILRFCRMTCGDKDSGDELYQDTMLKLLEKTKQLDIQQNVKSYALSISILLWKNKKKKYANRNRLMPMESLECMETEGNPAIADIYAMSPESCIMQEDEKRRKLHVWISDGEDRLVFDKANPKATLKLLGVCLNK